MLTEEDVAAILGVSMRTMRTYRQKKHLHYLKLEGRIYYLKLILYIDLILLCYEVQR
ncbi:helix-turn-helix domain-containing protein [Epilithonimonas bovis]|uniref:helix-turn-helix domain-containing protein n=1 Tax=Epilithonimonas bovis TaxID=421530 RepID=UPI00373FD142